MLSAIRIPLSEIVMVSWSFIRELAPEKFTRPGRRGDRGGGAP